MDLITRHNSLNNYLESSVFIDYEDPKILFTAQMLMDRMIAELDENPAVALPDPEMQLTRVTYEYVRDRISHSWDIGSSEVTLKASDVLSRKHGLCYAK